MSESDYTPDRDGPPHRFEPSGTYDAGREMCAECGMDRAADEHRPPYDNGGVIPPGVTWVRNDSGEDEQVIPRDPRS